MQILIRFFATLRDRANTASTTITLQREPATVAMLLSHIEQEYPELADALPTALVAINHEYAFSEDELSDGDEVALFPPVSGGAASPQSWPEYVAITADPLDLNDIIDHITHPETGAVCVFSGTVRGVTATDDGSLNTQHLEYAAYEPMAEKKLRQVVAEIRQQWPDIQGIAVVQRTGTLEVGEMTVLIACASGHRDQGCFEGARYGIDRLKEIVPVWKKEVGPDGSAWVEGHYQPTPEDVKPDQ